MDGSGLLPSLALCATVISWCAGGELDEATQGKCKKLFSWLGILSVSIHLPFGLQLIRKKKKQLKQHAPTTLFSLLCRDIRAIRRTRSKPRLRSKLWLGSSSRVPSDPRWVDDLHHRHLRLQRVGQRLALGRYRTAVRIQRYPKPERRRGSRR